MSRSPDALKVTKDQVIDLVWEWPRKVAAGEIEVPAHLAAFCKRQLAELEDPPEGMVWDPQREYQAIAFIELRCTLQQGEWAGAPFILLPWQRWVMGSVMGWVLEEDASRRYRELLLCTPKAAGKNPMLAALGLYLYVAEGEPEPEVIVAAADYDQARVAFGSIVAMIERSPQLRAEFRVLGGSDPRNIVINRDPGAWCRRIAWKQKGMGLSGTNLHAALIDELHEHPGDDLVKMIRSPMQARRQPMLLMATNAGPEMLGIAWDETESGRRIALGDEDRDDVFPVIFELEKDDDWEDEALWPKANPSLPVTPKLRYLRSEAARARTNAAARVHFLRLNMGRWPDGGFESWMAMRHWDETWIDELPEWCAEEKCWLGLDLSDRRDLTAAAAVWRDPTDPDDRYVLETVAWIPSVGLDERSRAERTPWLQWVEQGWIHATPGEIIDWTYPMAWIQGKAESPGIHALAYDPWRIGQFAREVKPYGLILEKTEPGAYMPPGTIRALPHPQGYAISAKAAANRAPAMPLSIELMEELVLKGRISIVRNPVLRMAAQGIRIIQDGKRNKTTTRINSKVKIDPMLAAIMATGTAGLDEPPEIATGTTVYSARRLVGGDYVA